MTDHEQEIRDAYKRRQDELLLMDADMGFWECFAWELLLRQRDGEAAEHAKILAPSPTPL